MSMGLNDLLFCGLEQQLSLLLDDFLKTFIGFAAVHYPLEEIEQSLAVRFERTAALTHP
jgi:hypothetical protein